MSQPWILKKAKLIHHAKFSINIAHTTAADKRIAYLFFIRWIKILIFVFADNVFGAVKWQRDILLCEILRLHNFRCGVVVILANRYNHIVTNGNIIICNVIIAFITLVKLYTAIDVIPITALHFSVDRWIEYFTHTIKPHKLPYVIDKIAPGLRQCLLVIGSLDNSLRTFFEVHRNGVILRFQRIFNYIVWVAFNFSE